MEIFNLGLMLETYPERKFFLKRKYVKPVYDLNLRNLIERRRTYLIWKRIFDIVFSSLVIVFILSWFFPLLYILIKIDSRGPVLFVQRRVGFLGRSFPCMKFRTMRVNNEANVLQATENDPRITRIGQFLRRSNLDELPQFFNVLAGHMSIVGPRPHMHRDCTSFSQKVSAYKFRNLVMPGITGVAQVKGYRGPAQDFESIFKRYQWDAFYVRNAGFWLDLRIIRMTADQTCGYLFRKLFLKDKMEHGNKIGHNTTEVPSKLAAIGA